MSALLHFMASILKGLDLLAWLVTLGPLWMAIAKSKQRKLYAVEVSKADVNGAGMAPSPVFRSTEAIEQGKMTERPFPEVATTYDLCQRAVKRYADKPALGTRQLIDIKTYEGVRFPTRVFGKTDWMTFKQVGEATRNFGAGLKHIGLKSYHLPADKEFENPDNCVILLYEDTCKEWFICAQGAHGQSITIATAYASLGADSVIHCVREANISTIFCNYNNVQNLLNRKDKMPNLKNIIYTTTGLLPSQTSKHPGKDDTINVYSFEEVINLGVQNPVPPTPPTENDIAVLMYTSGSTGNPKGVTVRHKHLVCLLGAIKSRAQLFEGETLIGFLPLAHIFEMQMEWFTFGYGGKIGYADPKSLTAGPGKCEPEGALAHFRPTLLGAVPKVWEVIKNGAEAKIKAGGAAKEFLFNTALEWKKAAMPHYRSTPVFDALVFSKIKAILGGRLRLAVSGGGAISPSVQEWVRTAIGCPLVGGYGLTETCAGLTIQAPDDWSIGVAGSPIDTNEVLLHSEPELCDSDGKPYLTTDTKHFDMDVKGRGEVWVRGHNITDGYFMLPKETSEAFDKKDGWFKTGDVAVMMPSGTLRIVDRKKNLVKLKGGEYVALERMNLTFNTNQYVDPDCGGVCVYGDGEMDRPVALVQINQAAVLDVANNQLGITSKDIEEVKQNPKVVDFIMKSLNETGKKAEPPLTSLETLAGVCLLTKPFTPADGTLTASLKLVPKKIQAAFKAELDQIKPKGIRN